VAEQSKAGLWWRWPLGGLVGLVLVAATVAYFAPPSNQPKLTPLERRGYLIFQREGCNYSCHMLETTYNRPYNVRDGRDGFPPDLRKTPRRSDDWYRAYLIDPQAVIPRSPMPSVGYLSSDELHALIAYLKKLNQSSAAGELKLVAAHSIPVTVKGLHEYEAGGAIYRENCIGCHGEWGDGAGPAGQMLSPEPRNFTDALWMSKQSEDYLFSVITNGKPNTAMPPFKDILTARQRALVMRYVEYFADPVARERMHLAESVPSLKLK
jgi:mono/diheme cytochrome c family protein